MRLKVAAFAAACLLPAVPASAAEMIGDVESSFAAASATSIFEVTADAPDDGIGLLRDVLLDSNRAAGFDANVPWQDSGLASDLAPGLADLPLTAGAVPEPDTWAMLIAGFGAVGASLRLTRRRRSLATI
jgi:hypothetical protein